MTREWWQVRIYGRDLGAVIEHYQASAVTIGLWNVLISKRRALRTGWRDEGQPHELDAFDERDLEQLIAGSYVNEHDARRAAIDHYRTNSLQIAELWTEKLRENMDMIGILSEPTDSGHVSKRA